MSTETGIPVQGTREGWLQDLASAVRPWFSDLGHEPPPPVRIGMGFTSKGARSNRIGECWYSHAIPDGTPEIFLHPRLTSQDVAHVLLHELIHASLGHGAKHGPKFRRVAVSLGLEGRMTATAPSPSLRDRLHAVTEALGPFPHAGLNHGGQRSTSPKQGTRMIKCVCPSCGYLVRTTKRWLSVAVPSCPVCLESLIPDTGP